MSQKKATTDVFVIHVLQGNPKHPPRQQLACPRRHRSQFDAVLEIGQILDREISSLAFVSYVRPMHVMTGF